MRSALVANVRAVAGPLGLPAVEHARKLPAWTLRLVGATRGLEDALRARDRRGVVAQLEDVSFWTGRTIADALGVEGDPRFRVQVDAATRAVFGAREATARARAFLMASAGNGRR